MVKSYNEFDAYDKYCAECDSNLVEILISIGNVEIPLCNECAKNLQEELSNVVNLKYCKDCKHFLESSEAKYNCGGCVARNIPREHCIVSPWQYTENDCEFFETIDIDKKAGE